MGLNQRIIVKFFWLDVWSTECGIIHDMVFILFHAGQSRHLVDWVADRCLPWSGGVWHSGCDGSVLYKRSIALFTNVNLCWSVLDVNQSLNYSNKRIEPTSPLRGYAAHASVRRRCMNSTIIWEWFTDLVYWIPFGTGMAVSLHAFKKTKNYGYLLITVFFLSPIIGVTQHQVSKFLYQEEWSRELNQRNLEIEMMYERGEPIEVHRKPLIIPLYELVLAVGVAISARQKNTLGANKRMEST